DYRAPATGSRFYSAGEGEAQHQQQGGRNGRDLEALEVGRKIEPVGTDEGVVFERQRGEELLKALPVGCGIEHRHIRRLRDGRLRQADLQHDQKRHQEEGDEPDIGKAPHQPRPPGTSRLHCSVSHAALAYRVSTTAASGVQLSHTWSSQPIGRSMSRVMLASAALMTKPLSRRTW